MYMNTFILRLPSISFSIDHLELADGRQSQCPTSSLISFFYYEIQIFEHMKNYTHIKIEHFVDVLISLGLTCNL